jgi:DNA-binding protein HU-beta
MASADDDVQLPDLQVIQRYSLAVRGATAPRGDVIAALEADLAWLTGSTRRRPAAPVQAAPARKAAPATKAAPVRTPAVKQAAPPPAAKKAAKGPAKKAAVKKAPAKKAARRR